MSSRFEAELEENLKDISEHVNSGSSEELFFKVDNRAVIERLGTLIKKFQSQL